MSLDKLVDGTQLDSDLTSVANAIRTKGGTSAQLAFPQGFVDAVDAIQTGTTPSGTKQISITQNGTTTEDVTNYASAEITVNVPSSGYSAADFGDYTKPTGYVKCDVTTFANQNNINQPQYFAWRSGITTLYMPNYNNTANTGYAFRGCGMKYGIFPSMSKMHNGTFINNTKLEGFDWGTGSFSGSTNDQFSGCSKLNKFIIRAASVRALPNISIFSNTPFASGKAGGTLYVPSDLVSSYQAASNWSTILGYANNSIQAIEGSTYETHFVDGTDLTPHTVTYNLTNCALSYSPATVYEPNVLITYLTANSGYTLSSVTVTRGGTDVTSAAYTSGTGRIALKASGNIVITATATAA